MGRDPSIWQRKNRGAWYTTIAGKKIRLGTSKKEAEKAFHRLMLDRGKADLSRETVTQLCDMYLTDAESRLKPLTFKSYKYYLQSFCDFAGTHVAEDLKPIILMNWLASHPEWNPNSRSLGITIVKIWSRWCKRHKCLSHSPFEDVSTPGITRRKAAPRGSVETLLENILNPHFRVFVELSLMLGTRPGELMALDASSIDLKAGVAIVDGKTGKRRVMLPDRAREILEPLVSRWPEGPVLRNSIDKPWNGGSVESQMVSIRKRAKLKGIVLYHMRGTFATRAIKNGVPSLLVSKLLGHADPTIVAKYYEQLDETDLKEAAEKANRTEIPESPSSSSDGVE